MNMEFCDTCEFRDTIIGPFDARCARRALDSMHHILGIIGTQDIFVLDGDRPTIPSSEAEAGYHEVLTQDVLRCIASVSNGGLPIPVEE